MENFAIELDVNSIFFNIKEVAITVGQKWLIKKIKEEERKQQKAKKAVKNRKHSYLYRTEPHPLVGWSIEVERWRQACLKSKRLELNESILNYSILGKALGRVRHQKGFNKLKSRLKLKSEFFSAAFEAEVASSYMSRGWRVEFVKEGSNRSPDLRVIRQDDSVFWVECKCRDKFTERDKKISSFWLELESALLRIIGPMKANVAIFVKSIGDPSRSEIDPLKSFILYQIENIKTVGIKRSVINPIVDPSQKYLVAVQKLSEPDAEIESKGIGFNSSEDFERVCMIAEMKQSEDKNTYVRNPIIMGFKNAIPSDKVTGIIHGFKSAVGQLPENEPGVIWIRIPDNAWNNDLYNSFSAAEKLIKSELSGTHNTRVNAVILMTRIFEKLEKDGSVSLGYKPLKKIIEHDNPKHTIA